MTEQKLTPATLRKEANWDGFPVGGFWHSLLVDAAISWEADLAELARLRELVEKQRAVVEAGKGLGLIAVSDCECSNCRAGRRLRIAIAALDQFEEEQP